MRFLANIVARRDARSSNVQSVFEDYAKQLGLDPVKFKTDFASSETNSAINASIRPRPPFCSTIKRLNHGA